VNTDDKSKNREQRDQSHDNLPDRLSKKSRSSVTHKYILVSSKPGVGKTSVTVNLALAFSKMNFKVGLMDANFISPDICRLLCLQDEIKLSSKSEINPIAYSDSIKVVPLAEACKKNKSPKEQSVSAAPDIIQQVSMIDWGRTDYLFFDTSAGPSEELHKVIGSVPDAKIIVVTAPNKVDQKSFSDMIDFIRNEDIHIWGWIENMRGFLYQNCDRRLSVMGTGPVGRAIYLNEIPFLGRIPVDVNMKKASNKNALFTEYPCRYEIEAFDMIAERIIVLNKKKINRSQHLEVMQC
jgi:ATP-binding protein involved in chromosome partitioning